MFDWNDMDVGVPGQNAERKFRQTAQVRLEGVLPRVYDTPLPPHDQPAGSRAYPIGGIQGNVSVKKQTGIWIEQGAQPGHAAKTPTR